MRSLRRRLASALLTSASVAAVPVWLCKPGIPDNPCERSLTTTLISPSGDALRVRHTKAKKHPKIDCFYVYPTVSDQPGPNATLDIEPAERSSALFQAARYSKECRVFAPMYRQFTFAAIFGGLITQEVLDIAYADVRDAWNDYLQKYNEGRGVVLIGHSQGTSMLTRLDPRATDRMRCLPQIGLRDPPRQPRGPGTG
jgi:hypothetical protein